MSIFSKKGKFYLLCLICLSCFWACSKENKASNDLSKLVPGSYEGKVGGYLERIVFKADGVYSHEVSENNAIIVAESGKWSILKEKSCIWLQADERFTQIYDPMRKKAYKSEEKYITYVYFPLFYGVTFSSITPSVDSEYILSKK